MKEAVVVRTVTESVMSRAAYEQWLEALRGTWPETMLADLREKHQGSWTSQYAERTTSTFVTVSFGGAEKIP